MTLRVARPQCGFRASSAKCLAKRKICNFRDLGGVDDGTRTRDGRNHNPGLYQLSYVHHRKPPTRDGAPGRNRTCNRRLRRPVLYPVELRAPNPRKNKAPSVFPGRISDLRRTESEVRADYIASFHGLAPKDASSAIGRPNAVVRFSAENTARKNISTTAEPAPAIVQMERQS